MVNESQGQKGDELPPSSHTKKTEAAPSLISIHDGDNDNNKTQESYNKLVETKEKETRVGPQLFPNAIPSSQPTYVTSTIKKTDVIATFQQHPSKHGGSDEGLSPPKSTSRSITSSSAADPPKPGLFPATDTTSLSAAIITSRDIEIKEKLGKMDLDDYPLNNTNNNDASDSIVNDRTSDVKKRRERHAANRSNFINNYNMNTIKNNVNYKEEEIDEDTSNCVVHEDFQDVNVEINQQQQLFPGAVAVDGISIGNREQLHQYDSTMGNLSFTNEEEKAEEEERVTEEDKPSHLVVPHATIVDEQENQTVYHATEIDDRIDDTRIKKMGLCICLAVSMFIIIIIAVAVPLALRNRIVTMAPTVSTLPSRLPSTAPTSIPTFIPSASPSFSLSPTRTRVDITIVLQLDDKPEEVGWSLVCNGEDVDGVEANTRYKTSNNKRIEEPIEVSQADNCTIDFINTGSDDGQLNKRYYEIYYGTNTRNCGSRLANIHGNFVNTTSRNFIVELPKNYTTWTQIGGDELFCDRCPPVATGDLLGLQERDFSGSSVSISTTGNIIVVGAPAFLEDRPGSAQVYKLNASDDRYVLLDQSLHSGNGTHGEEDAADLFGAAVSISNDGTIIAVGAPYKNNLTGSVYIYQLDVTENKIQTTQEIMGDNEGDQFGSSIDVSGDGKTIIIGAGADDGDGRSIVVGEGADGPRKYAKVYYHKNINNNNDNGWIQIGNTINVTGTSPSFRDYTLVISGDASDYVIGFSVSISNNGNIIAVGAPDANNYTGLVNIYQYNESTNNWDDYGSNNDTVFVGDDKYDRFGDGLSLSSSGDVVAISAPDKNCINKNKGLVCGAVKIFQLNSNTNNWEQLGNSIGGEEGGDYSGYHQGVKLSDDGMIVAIGSHGNNNNAGSVRIFQYDLHNNEWIQISQDIDGSVSVSDSSSGTSISLSGDGSIVAIGANKNDGWDDYFLPIENEDASTNRGHVRIYRQGRNDD